uniref:Ig-like domain-containing protein n=1 Tax=Chrysemys picta bellii TaxID=8478 RepID=A0A8C3F7S0_CHRPI
MESLGDALELLPTKPVRTLGSLVSLSRLASGQEAHTASPPGSDPGAVSILCPSVRFPQRILPGGVLGKPEGPAHTPTSQSDVALSQPVEQKTGPLSRVHFGGPTPSQGCWLRSDPKAGTGCLRGRQWDPLTPVSPVPPEVTVFPRGPVELDEPNVLICFVDKFFPPVLRLTWLKNGQEVTGGVSETDFYLRQDNSFRKFSYLPFFPSPGDFYDCRVEHWGLPKPFTKHWEVQVHTPVPKTTETLVCALGLAVSIIAGTILIIKGMKMNAARNPRGPL